MTQDQIKQKADELIDSFIPLFIDANADIWTKPAKQCALILCDEIIKNNDNIKKYLIGGGVVFENTEYWQSIKQHIENNY